MPTHCVLPGIAFALQGLRRAVVSEALSGSELKRSGPITEKACRPLLSIVCKRRFKCLIPSPVFDWFPVALQRWPMKLLFQIPLQTHRLKPIDVVQSICSYPYWNSCCLIFSQWEPLQLAFCVHDPSGLWCCPDYRSGRIFQGHPGAFPAPHLEPAISRSSDSFQWNMLFRVASEGVYT